MKHPFQRPLFLVLIFRPSEETEDFDTPQEDFVDFEDSTYDALNRLTAIVQTPTPEGILENIFGADAVNILNAQYVGKDRPQSYTFGNNVQTTFAYDDLKRLTSLNVEHGTSNIEQFSYGYDKTGNRLFENRSMFNVLSSMREEESREFTYDSIYRLTRSVGPSITHEWTLDGVDNWLEKIRRTGVPNEHGTWNIEHRTSFSPNEVNAYTTVNGTPYIYDENGNLIDDGTNLYYYNYRNFLTRVVNKSDATEVASYGYDALGRRIFKTVDGQMTRFVYEGIHIIAEIAPDNTISKEFIYGDSIDDPIAVIARSGSDEAIYYYHKDGLGSTTALTDSEGNIAETYQYGPYGDPEIHDASGALLEESAAGNPFLYTGQFFDSETNFYYYKARYYHPTLGRFLQRDPLGYVDGYNLYAYTANNPINWIDPLGTEYRKATGATVNPSPGNPQILMTGNVDDLFGTEPRPGQVYYFTHGAMGPITRHLAVEIEPDSLTGERRIYSAGKYQGRDVTYIRSLQEELQWRSGEIYYSNQSFDVRKLTKHAEQNAGLPYDFSNLVLFDTPGEEICSSAVASCLSAAGIKLGNYSPLIRPVEVAHDSALTKIGEFKYGGWSYDKEGIQNVIRDDIAPIINNINLGQFLKKPSFGGLQ